MRVDKENRSRAGPHASEDPLLVRRVSTSAQSPPLRSHQSQVDKDLTHRLEAGSSCLQGSSSKQDSDPTPKQPSTAAYQPATAGTCGPSTKPGPQAGALPSAVEVG